MNSTVSGSHSNSGPADSPPPITSHAAGPPQPMSMHMGGAPFAAATVSSAENVGSLPGGGASNTAGDFSGKKKRGRPRKYDSDGNLIIRTPKAETVGSSPPGLSFMPNSASGSGKVRKSRGRASAAGNWQLVSSLGALSATTVGCDFQPQVITVNPGEDVSAKIYSFTQKGFGGICVLSAVGGVSNVTLRQPGSTGGILTFEGRFQVVSLTGSFVISETRGSRSVDGALSVSLAGADGRIVGGGVASLLIAATPVQVVIGTFMPKGHCKLQKRKYNRTSTPSSATPLAESVTPAVPISQAKPAGGINSVFEQSHGEDANQTPPSMPIGSPFNPGWNGAVQASNQGPSPDINLSVSSE